MQKSGRFCHIIPENIIPVDRSGWHLRINAIHWVSLGVHVNIEDICDKVLLFLQI